MSTIADHRNPFLRRNPYSLPHHTPAGTISKSQTSIRHQSPSLSNVQATPTRPPPSFPAAFGRPSQLNTPQPQHIRKKNIR